jgi:ABC-2 type transport system permease protein
MFSATLQLPEVVDAAVSAFPLKALADGLRSTYDPAAAGVPVVDLIVLAAWALAGLVIAHRWFRWDP